MPDKQWIRDFATERYELVLRNSKIELTETEQVVQGVYEGLETKRGRTQETPEYKNMKQFLKNLKDQVELQESEDFKNFYIERVVQHMEGLSPFTLEYLYNIRVADKELAKVEEDLFGDVSDYLQVATGSVKFDA